DGDRKTVIAYLEKLNTTTCLELIDFIEYKVMLDNKKLVTIPERINPIIEKEKIEQRVPFGYRTQAPADVQHLIRNGSSTGPSADFTVKSPFLNIFRFEGMGGKYEKELGVTPYKEEEHILKQGYEEFILRYRNVGSELVIDDHGNIFFLYDEKSAKEEARKYRGTMPLERRPVDLAVRLFVLNPGCTTQPITFDSIYPGFQFVRIFPWPANLDEISSSQWDIATSRFEIKARVTGLDDKGKEVGSEEVNGGDNVVFNNEVKSHMRHIAKFRVENNSNRPLIFMIMVREDQDNYNGQMERIWPANETIPEGDSIDINETSLSRQRYNENGIPQPFFEYSIGAWL
ncbi:MAG: hypothetical protein Q8O36_04135, partial [Candidatus Omnitrophota bacterium]|nr:hypothetical protein [Candidatus Omnitrophota bacterium]